MLKKSLFILFALTVFAFPAYALEDNTVYPTAAEKPESTQFENKERKDLNMFNQELKARFAEKKASAEAKKLEIKNLLEQKMRYSEQQKTLLKNRLELFKDQEKKDSILKLDTKIASISSKRTEKMSEAVSKLTTVLDSIKNKTNQLDSSCETTNLNSAILTAEKALASASAAVELQAKKTYQLNITDETTAKENIGTVLKQLQTDLRNTHKAVMDAKQAVVKAAVELNKTKRCDKVSVTPAPTTATVTVNPTTVPTVTLRPTAVEGE